jgi:hypothetical protein
VVFIFQKKTNTKKKYKKMKDEIREGVEFLRQFLAKYGNSLTPTQIDTFAAKLNRMLEERYVNHWYVDHPMKGQAFRCLRLKRSENYIDPVLERLLSDLGLTLAQLGLPNDFTLWIDPGEVTVRFGDQVGYTYSIAKVIGPPPQLATTAVSNLQSNEDLVSKITDDEPASAVATSLIVQSSEKIFDEKLTAFIRQNSTSLPAHMPPPTSVISPTTLCDITGDFNEDDVSSLLMTDDLIDKLANNSTNATTLLSPEKRTISPPQFPPIGSNFTPKQQQQLNHKNSSNITINNGHPPGLNGRSQPPPIGSSNLQQNNNNFNELLANNINRLSFNDSCYYSSSSSCASSFGSSNYEDNLTSGNLGWFKSATPTMPQVKSQPSPAITMTSTIHEIPNAAYLLSQMEFNNEPLLQQPSPSSYHQPQQHNHGHHHNHQHHHHHGKKNNVVSGVNNMASGSTSLLPNAAFGSNFSGNAMSSMSAVGGGSSNSFGGRFSDLNGLGLNMNGQMMNSNMYSDTSSDRSDTPNSCITSSSVSFYEISHLL